MTQNLDAQSGVEELSGYEAGLTGDGQIKIALEVMLQNPDGIATMSQIYAAVNEVMKRENPAYTLSDQGKDSLRFFVNNIARKSGYVEQVEGGWHITPGGEWYIKAGRPILRKDRTDGN